MKTNEYITRFNGLYCYFAAFTSDLLFYIAIDTLFYTVVKGYDAQQIVLLTTITSVISLVLRLPIIKLINIIGNTISVRIGVLFLLIASILITFGSSYIVVLTGVLFYQLAFIFTSMLTVILKNNLLVQNREDKFLKMKSKASTLYSVITALIAFVSGSLFNINYYLPMIFCIIICIINFCLSFYIKDISNNDININKESRRNKLNFSKLIILVFLIYGIFFALVYLGQEEGKLLIQYELQDIYDISKTSMYLSIIICISRIVRIIGDITFPFLYKKLSDKIALILAVLLLLSLIFLVFGSILNAIVVMAIGYFIILAIRDSFNIYSQDLVLKITNESEQKNAIAYLEFSKKVLTTIISLLVSALLLKLQLVYVLAIVGTFAILEVYIVKKLYNMLRKS